MLTKSSEQDVCMFHDVVGMAADRCDCEHGSCCPQQAVALSVSTQALAARTSRQRTVVDHQQGRCCRRR